jgi:6,7-dimethyl-8-ribityllumazine synthase
VTEPRFAIAVGRFYADLAERLVAGAQDVLVAATGAAADVFEVPGAFELPLAAKYAAESGRYAGVVCLGAVIRGETSHYDHVCNEAARGFGVLTVETMEQALARSGGGKRHQGRDAAEAVLRMAALRSELA